VCASGGKKQRWQKKSGTTVAKKLFFLPALCPKMSQINYFFATNVVRKGRSRRHLFSPIIPAGKFTPNPNLSSTG